MSQLKYDIFSKIPLLLFQKHHKDLRALAFFSVILKSVWTWIWIYISQVQDSRHTLRLYNLLHSDFGAVEPHIETTLLILCF